MPQKTTAWYVGPQHTWADGYFGNTPDETMDSFGRLVTRIGEKLHRQGATEGVVLLDAKAARITHMEDPMDGNRHRALDSAAAAGWDSGRLGAWTTFYAKGRPDVHVGRIERLTSDGAEDERHWPFAAHLFPADLVSILQAWHRLTGVAWHDGAAVMGLELMRATMTAYKVVGRDGKQQQHRPTLREDSTPDDAQVSMWTPQMWHPTSAPGRWLHGYDKVRAGITAAGVAKLAPGKLRRWRGPFDPKRAGWWLIEVPAWNIDEIPHPFGPTAMATSRRVGGQNRMWVTTATMDLAAELAAEGVLSMPEVIDSMTGPQRAVLAPFAQRIERAYAAPTEGDYDDIARAAVRSALKLAGNAGIGLTGKVIRFDDEGKAQDTIPSIWRRDWFLSINATKQANAFRTFWKIWKEEQRAPIALDDDKIYYDSDEADPTAAAPAAIRAGLTKDTAGTYRAETTVQRRKRSK